MGFTVGPEGRGNSDEAGLMVGVIGASVGSSPPPGDGVLFSVDGSPPSPGDGVWSSLALSLFLDNFKPLEFLEPLDFFKLPFPLPLLLAPRLISSS